MKSTRWFFFFILALLALSLGSCPPAPQGPVTSPPPARMTETAPITTTSAPVPPASMRVIDLPVPRLQPSTGEGPTTVRVLAEFDLEASGDVYLRSTSGVLKANDDGEAGALKLLKDDTAIGFEDLTRLVDGQFTFSFPSRLTLVPGKTRLRIITDSTHDRGDTLQIELRSIVTNLADMNTVVRWHPVVCGE